LMGGSAAPGVMYFIIIYVPAAAMPVKRILAWWQWQQGE
jgi:hypothetical protein